MAIEVVIDGVEYISHPVPNDSSCEIGPLRCALYDRTRRWTDLAEHGVKGTCETRVFFVKSEYPKLELQIITHRLKS